MPEQESDEGKEEELFGDDPPPEPLSDLLSRGPSNLFHGCSNGRHVKSRRVRVEAVGHQCGRKKREKNRVGASLDVSLDLAVRPAGENQGRGQPSQDGAACIGEEIKRRGCSRRSKELQGFGRASEEEPDSSALKDQARRTRSG